MRIVNAAVALEAEDSLHVARLLLLLRSCGGRDGTQPMGGVLKLAQLDFFLRYPSCLARALVGPLSAASSVVIEDFELTSIESSMIRFRYGPWDPRYRRWLALIAARGMLKMSVAGRNLHISLTGNGVALAEQLAGQPSLLALHRRSKLVNKALGGKSASAIADFIHAKFPEILTFRIGEEIRL